MRITHRALPGTTGEARMIALSPTDVRVCEACWNAPVTAARHTHQPCDLLCEECTEGDYPRRVDLFPPFGVYGLTTRKILNDGRHGSGPRSPRPTRAHHCPTRPRHRHRRERRRCHRRPVTAWPLPVAYGAVRGVRVGPGRGRS